MLPTLRENKALQSGGRTHARGMVGVLHYGLIAQWCSELAFLSLKRAIYSQRRAPGSWRGNYTVTS
jgi:hypothetical protein